MDTLSKKMLINKDGDSLSVEEALKNKRIIVYYFAEQHSKNCATVTEKLKELYEENLKRTKHLEIIFVSKDEDEKTMMNFFKTYQGSWLAIPHGDTAVDELVIKYGVTNTPTIVVVNISGDVITTDGRREILDIGVNVLTTWDD